LGGRDKEKAVAESVSWQARLSLSDTNHDGRITASEYIAHPPMEKPANMTTANFNKILKRAFLRIDSNKDQQVDEVEVGAKEKTILQEQILRELLAKQIAKAMMERQIRDEIMSQNTTSLDELKQLLNSV
jgi:hypothetical protein